MGVQGHHEPNEFLQAGRVIFRSIRSHPMSRPRMEALRSSDVRVEAFRRWRLTMRSG